MKRHISLAIIMLMTFCSTSSAQTQNDIIRTSARITELIMQRNQLKQRITSEDKKRNSQIAGVAPGQMELINIRQDSLCLELRSQLTEIELEIMELTATVQGTGNSVSPTPQGTASVQQLIQSIRQNRLSRKEEEAEKIE